MGKTKDVRDAVEAELDFDPRVDATDITVKNVGGEVALDGTVSSYPSTWRPAPPPNALPASPRCSTTSRSCCRSGITATTRS
jgi:hypothetical protein